MNKYAITGCACLFPGMKDQYQLWDQVLKAKPIPQISLSARWNMKRSVFFDPDPENEDTIYIDRTFCSLPCLNHVQLGTKIIAQLLTHADLTPDETGLVIAVSWNELEHCQNEVKFWLNDLPQEPGMQRDWSAYYQSTAQKMNQIARNTGIKGPVCSIDTACASSLYAINHAINLINSKQARAVVVLGMSQILTPLLMQSFSRIKAISPRMRCLPFSRHASGLIPGEGGGAVLIEPISSALQKNRPVQAVIHNIGLSSDGAGSSFFSPDKEGQQSAYQAAYQSDPGLQVDYIETHGTATRLGDKAELEALIQFFQNRIGKNKKLTIGSVKSIIGHTLTASGMASLIKCLNILHHKTIPPHINIEPLAQLKDSCIRLNTTPERLGKKNIYFTGISAFGFGGSNAHLVIKSKHQSNPVVELAEQSYSCPALAIIDFEAAFGPYIGTAKCQKLFHQFFQSIQSNQSFQSSQAYQSRFAWQAPPRDRFPIADQTIEGLFFPGQTTIDIKAFRCGPKIIGEIEPFQVMTTFLINQLLARHKNKENLHQTGLILCNNQESDINYSHFRQHKMTDFKNLEKMFPSLSVDQILSGLGSMYSGYPAFHNDIRAFHQTISGQADTFWRTLSTLGNYLEKHCQTIIFGAGHYCKSMFNLKKTAAYLVEGAAFYLIKPLKTALERQDHVLAVIHAVIPGHGADTVEKACRICQFPYHKIDCQMQYQINKNNQTHLFSLNWDLGEANGIEILSHLLFSQPGQCQALEIFNENKKLFTIILEKKDQLQTNDQPPQFPFKLCFTDPGLKNLIKQSKKKPDREQPGDFAISNSKQYQKQFLEVMHHYSKLQKFLIKKKTKKCISQPVFKQSVITQKIQCLKKNPCHRLLQNIRINQKNNCFQSKLQIPFHCPYFFDHPQDHLPGVLLLESAIQQFELLNLLSDKQNEKQFFFPSYCSISFQKWAEIKPPIIVQSSQVKNKPDQLRGRLNQMAHQICSFELKGKYWQRDLYRDNYKSTPIAQKPAPLALVNKTKKENIFISSLINKEDQHSAACYLIPPSINHYFSDYDQEIYPILYLVEASRQFGRLLTNVRQDLFKKNSFPRNSPIILYQVTLLLNYPLYRIFPLKLNLETDNIQPVNAEAVQFEIQVICQDRVIGQVTQLAQILNEKEYQASRWK